MPRALETIRRMRGGAQSHLMRCSDGFFYVVKPSNNVQVQRNTGRILCNEFLGSRIAALMGLPVPPCEVIEVSAELIELSGELRIHAGGRAEPWLPGPHFGSRYPGEPSRAVVMDLLPDAQLRDVENLRDFAGILLADKLGCNVNGRQAIFQPSPSGAGYRATFVDQGFYFGADAWQFPDAPLRGLYWRNRVYEGVRGMHSFEPWLTRLEESITLDVIGAIASEIPPQWFDWDIAALERLLLEIDARRKRVRQLVLDARNSHRQPFPNWQGR